MKIYASGDAQSACKPGEFIDAEMERVVGIIDLGGNNGSNNYGWCSIKAVISKNNTLYILDFPSDVRIETSDGIIIIDSNMIKSCEFSPWHPSLSDIQYYDLYLYHTSMFE